MRPRSRKGRSILAFLTLVVALGTRIDAMASSPRTLTFEQRLEAQRRIEEVLWARRIWPPGNPTPKPQLASVLSEDALRIRVEDDLRRSNALVALRGHALSADELHAELERMERDSRDPRTLTAMFAALGDDPFLEAEIVARPALAERLLRSLYVQDASIGASDTTDSRPGYEPWWRQHRLDFSPEIAAIDGAIDAVASPEASCANDTWQPTANGVPDARANHTAVWTGTEMIVFGGDENENDNSPWRYVPATDTWTQGSHLGAPVERWGHASVWTGTEVLIWGGFITNYTNTGGRYSPATDSWTAMSVTNAPSPRRDAPAVWTGTDMIIWGGTAGGTPLQTGGRYTPSSNTWSAMSATNAPTGRTGHTMVWSGSEAIVWGGYDGTVRLNTGARYNPSTDQWTSTTTTGAPVARSLHSAVWSGTEMIVWGGNGATTALQTGGRYNPSTNKWKATSTTGAPTAREEQTAIWTGTQMIVWGGSVTGSVWPVAGGRYTPSSDLWSGTTTIGAPVGRTSHSAVWTGTEMIVFGGDNRYADFRTGGRYFPSSDSWLPTSVGLGLTPRGASSAVWTGAEMLVWAEDGPSIQTGDRYLPATDSWSPMASAGGPTGATRESAVWTGSEMIVWGGTHPTQGFTTVNDGGRYSPTNNQWTPTSLVGAPEPRAQHVAVWTGSKMIVWGGGTDGIEGFLAVDTGGIYDPLSNGWTPTPTAGAPSPRRGHSGVWTGSELVVWGGGVDYGIGSRDGGRYSPAADSWTPTTLAGAPSDRTEFQAVWSGAEMIVWGGSLWNSQYMNDGARYDPSIDTWVPMSQTSAPTARTRHRAVWTGGEMIVWGGFPDDDVPGGRYSPGDDTWSSTTLVGAPFSRTGHSGVFTGDEAIFWGGGTTGGRYCAPCPNPVTAFRDQDGDGHGVRGAGYAYRCDGTVPAGFAATADDCNDANAAVHPGAPEVCNGLDDDCSNSVDDVAIPSGPLLVGASRDGDTLHLSWGTVVFATGYDVVKGDLATLRSTAGDFTVSTTSCLANDTTALTQDDPEVLASEQTRWYLVRPSNCSGAGSYEDDGNAASGVRDESITASPSACP